MSLIDHEAIQVDRSGLGPPFLHFFLQDRDGARREVAVWAPPPTPWEAGSTFRGWLFIEGHTTYDPPRRVLGEGPWQPVWLAFQVIERYADEYQLSRVT